MSQSVTFTASESDNGARVDLAVATRYAELSRSQIRSSILEHRLLVNGHTVKPAHRLHAGDIVSGHIPDPPPLSARPEDISLTIVYEDADLAVIDKPAGLVVHPAPGHASGTLANALASRFPSTLSVGPGFRPGIVHRLDKDTSGLMVVALTPAAQRSLQRQLAAREVRRHYLALAAGRVEPEAATIDAPIGRDPRSRERMAAHGFAARAAQTTYRVRQYRGPFSYLDVALHTGRTHQIRVHLSGLGHPLAGDLLYGGPAIPGLGRQFLHAHRLEIRSPSTAQDMHFVSPLPPDLQHFLDSLPPADAA
ncbi:MAG TPA: RluA family pseudouridine synthase [Chloroflexota bacterium]|nr:RluA family pseudouridine synthase [Chloroflexota bacterium]